MVAAVGFGWRMLMSSCRAMRLVRDVVDGHTWGALVLYSVMS